MQQPSSIALEFVESAAVGDLNGLASLIGDGYRSVDLTRSASESRTRFLAGVRQLHSAFEDVDVSAVVAVSAAESAGVYWVARGRHRDRFMGVPPTGHLVSLCGFSLLSIVGGRVCKAVHLWDLAGLLRDLRLLADLPSGQRNADGDFVLLDQVSNLRESRDRVNNHNTFGP